MTLFGMNLLDHAVTLRLANVTSPTGVKVVVENYILESNHDRLWSKLVRLNGKTLHMKRDDALPSLKPIVDEFDNAAAVHLVLPSYSLAFYVIDGLEGRACAS